MEKIKKLFLKYREIITYIIVGGLTTLVRWGTTAIFEDVFSFIKVDVTRSIIVTAVSLIVTILFAFPPNKLIVFESKSFKKGIIGIEFISFISARAVVSLIELVGIPVICGIFGISNLITTMVVSIISLIANYIFSKLFIFKDRVGKEDKKDNKEKVKATAKDKFIATVLILVCFVVFAISFSFWTVEMVQTIF